MRLQLYGLYAKATQHILRRCERVYADCITGHVLRCREQVLAGETCVSKRAMLAWDLQLTPQMDPVATLCDQPPLALSNGPHQVYVPEIPLLHTHNQSHVA